MPKYIVKRLLISIPIFIGITFIVFMLANLAPGGPLDIIAASANMSQEQLEALKVSMGLDKPVLVRYGIWLRDLFHGDLGMSTKTAQEVSHIIGQRIGPSLTLSVTSLAVTVVLGIALGILSAYKPYSFWDNFSSAIAFLGTSIPSFVVSLVLIYIFAVKLKALPAQGMYAASGGGGLKDLSIHLVLPVVVMCFQSIGNYIKQTRGSILEVMNEDYIKTARAKGLKEITITIRHALRNAWIPIVTQIGLSVPYVIGGAVVTEQIFGWPGIGSLMVSSISGRDYNVIMGVTVLIAVVVLVANIVLDVLYAYLDPRISTDA